MLKLTPLFSQEGRDGSESLNRNNCFSLLEIIFQINLLKGKSSSFVQVQRSFKLPL
jgi:hypothetical protein